MYIIYVHIIYVHIIYVYHVTMYFILKGTFSGTQFPLCSVQGKSGRTEGLLRLSRALGEAWVDFQHEQLTTKWFFYPSSLRLNELLSWKLRRQGTPLEHHGRPNSPDGASKSGLSRCYQFQATFDTCSQKLTRHFHSSTNSVSDLHRLGVDSDSCLVTLATIKNR